MCGGRLDPASIELKITSPTYRTAPGDGSGRAPRVVC